ncbi:hypothetical protein L0152_32735 [bacterium]|nr:hypothetical protein [bacterium]
MFIIAMCLTLMAASIAAFAGYSFGETLESFAVMLQLFGIPFFGLLLGAGAGATLRSSGRKAEEDIPLPATKRIFAAYIASLIYLSILTLILFAIVTLSSIFLVDDLQPYFLMITVLPLHSAAFVFSYWFSQSLIGGIAAIIATGASAFVLCFNNELFLRSVESGPEIFISLLAIAVLPSLVIVDSDMSILLVAVGVVIAITVHLALLFWIVNNTELEKKTWLPMKIAAAILVFSALSLSIWGVFSLGIAYDQVFVPHCH